MRADFTLRKGYNKLLKISKKVDFNENGIFLYIKDIAVNLFELNVKTIEEDEFDSVSDGIFIW